MSSAQADSDDEDLLAAAKQWANQNDNGEARPSQASTSETYSLHLTQLSFDAKEYDIRQLFEKRGCLLSSVRLVYDRFEGAKLFRGVAFIDVSDKTSYEKALALDRAVFLGRKINVRPTKTHQELADIVARKKELIAATIQREKEKNDNSNSSCGKQEKLSKKKADKPVAKKCDNDRKLTKKERNRRAAIIMNRQRGRPKSK
jgi:RNA recognition motif-containing protein